MLPIHSMSAQTRHILQAHRNGSLHNQRILSIFAIVLTVAIACALLLVVSSGTAFAAPLGAAGIFVGQTTAAAAVGLSLTAGIIAAFTVIHLSLSLRR